LFNEHVRDTILSQGFDWVELVYGPVYLHVSYWFILKCRGWILVVQRDTLCVSARLWEECVNEQVLLLLICLCYQPCAFLPGLLLVSGCVSAPRQMCQLMRIYVPSRWFSDLCGPGSPSSGPFLTSLLLLHISFWWFCIPHVLRLLGRFAGHMIFRPAASFPFRSVLVVMTTSTSHRATACSLGPALL
jgi:hypothetical protein